MKPTFRFSIAAVLFGVAIIAGYFAGFSRGHHEGHDRWVNLPTYTKTYLVNKIVCAQHLDTHKNLGLPGAISDSDFEPLLNDIYEKVLPHVWANDDNTKIEAYVPNLSIIVTGNATIHHEIERHLALERLNADQRIVGYQNPDSG